MSLILAPGLSALGASSNVPKIQNNELVISTLNDHGATSSIQVLSHLRAFGSGTATIQEDQKFKLSSVRNLYGKEKISVKDNKLSVNLDMGSDRGYGDVYYMSDLDKSEISKVKMPVSVKVSYYLDGEKMEPSKMAGKSGHLKIVTELENLTGSMKSLEYKNSQGEMVKTEAKIYTPYVVSLSGWEFDNKLFSHVVAPGVSGKSAEGVVVDVQGKSTVSWSVPLIPPAYPAVQYTTLEADGRNIELPSFKIAVVPILPTTSAEDTLGSVQNSLSQLYGAFAQIENGVGSPTKDATLLFGLTSLKGGLGDLGGGIASLGDSVKKLLTGVSNPSFKAATFDAAKGVDGSGNKPGVREAVNMGKAALDTQVIPSIGKLEAFMGKPGTAPVPPTASTSLYNDTSLLKGVVGTQVTTPTTPTATTSLYNDITLLKGVVGTQVTTPTTPTATTSLYNDITLLKGVVGNQVTTSTTPTATTSLYNDVVYLNGLLKGTPLAPVGGAMALKIKGSSDIINVAMEPKVKGSSDIINAAMVPKIKGSSDIVNGAMLPKIVGVGTGLNALEQGVKSLSEAMAKTDAGLGLISTGIGPIDANGEAVKVMVNGKPGTILYALSYFKDSIDGKVLPGIDQLVAGSNKIGAGSGQAKTGISAGLDKMLTAPAIISALKDKAAQVDSFLGKPEGAQATVAYVFQTPKVSQQGTVMYYGLGAIVIVLAILFAVGRPPKTIKSVQDASQTV